MDYKLKSQFLAMYCMMLADGVIDAREMAVLYRIGKGCYGLSEQEIINTIKESGSSFIMPETLENKVEFLCHMAEIALADGVVEESEKSMMIKYVKRLGFIPENAENISDYIIDQVKQEIPTSTIIENIVK